MMSKNSIVPFLKDYLIKFLTRPFLLDTNEVIYQYIERNVSILNFLFTVHCDCTELRYLYKRL